MFGFDVIQDPAFTAKRETDIEGKILAAMDALQKHDMVFVHLKAPDLFAHDHEPFGKKDVLEQFDAALAPLMDQQIIIACAADHSTDSNSGKHTADPVPALLYTPGKDLPVNAIKFGESACRTGNMERQSSSAFLQRVLASMQGNESH
jgi:2,3-bisphosphoglycerate-independent phosphoglycerate mutase